MVEFSLTELNPDLTNEDWQRALARMVGEDDPSQPLPSFWSDRVLWLDFLPLWEGRQGCTSDGVLPGTTNPGHGIFTTDTAVTSVHTLRRVPMSQVALTVHTVSGKRHAVGI